jgi:hypothetical protein
MNENLEKDKTESKYLRDLEKYSNLCSFFIDTDDTLKLVDTFYFHNIGNIYEIVTNVTNNWTRIRIYHTATNGIIINITDSSYKNALIRAVGQFIEWKMAENQPHI